MTRTTSQLFDLKGKTALITGGSRGLGLQMAHALGEAGARIMLTSRKAGDLEEAAAELQSAGIDARVRGGLRDREEDIHRLVDETLTCMGEIDIPSTTLAHLGRWPKTIRSRAGTRSGPQHSRLLPPGAAVAKRSMIARRSGRIINIASMRAWGGNPKELTMVAYNRPGRVITYPGLGLRVGQVHITVNAICPVSSRARLTQATLNSLGEDKLAAHAPLERLGDDEDLKGVTLLFASDASKHITGQWLAVDGGVSVITGG